MASSVGVDPAAELRDLAVDGDATVGDQVVADAPRPEPGRASTFCSRSPSTGRSDASVTAGQ